MKRVLLLSALAIASSMVVALAHTAPAPRQGRQAIPAAKITTIAAFPGVSANEVAAGAKGNLLYMTTDSGVVLVYDRSRKTTSVALKGDYSGIIVSPTGTHLGLSRDTEDHKAQNMWTVAIDPATGIATGAPRRVSMTPSGAMRISPDGKEIAFVAYSEKSDASIVVVPINGGRERAIAEGFFEAGPIRWSPDGRFIYVGKWTMLRNSYVVRIPARGGDAVELTPSVKSPYPLISPDGRYVMALTAEKALDLTFSFYDANKQKLGDVGVKFPVSGSRIDHAWTNDGYHQVWALKTAAVAAHTADFAGPSNRILPGINGPNVSLSPNGKFILSEEFDATSGLQTVLRDADGSNPKPLAPIGRSQEEYAGVRRYVSPWSSDSRFVTYATDSMRSLVVYDTKTGKVTPIAHADQAIFEQHFRSDGKAVLYVSVDGALTKQTLTLTVREATLDGRVRVLRDMTTELADWSPLAIALIGDSIMYHRGTASIVPFKGAPRVLFDRVPQGMFVGVGQAPFLASLSPDNKWMARTAINRKGIDLAAIDGSSKRTIPVSFAFSQNPVKFHPNGREIIAPAAASDGSPAGLMAVPLDGTAPRRLVTFGKNEKLMSYSISSDGKTILYVVGGAPSTVLLDVDLSPGIPGRH